ncbi:MAG: Oxidoreductase FAD-binding domain protein [Desulfonauticus sp. 38_4375]|nr:MAG: Oxidoreductase FAD-binding domain protein [Desulfonauticus sp. 38_4375]
MKDKFSPYVPRVATLKAKKKLSDFVTLFEFAQDNGKPLAHRPGQFIQLSLFGIGEAPFSITSPPRSDHHHFEIAVRKIGTVTTALHNLEVGAKVGVRGPYGSYFPMHKFVEQDVLFVAGGLGFIPLRSLLNYMLRHRDEYGRIMVLVGTRNPKERIFIDQIEEMKKRTDVEVLETVDSPDETWKGNVGVITTLLPKVKIEPESTYVAMVGPPVMYKFVINECKKIGIDEKRIYVSLERRMKCGLGKCGHCQINGINCCVDGPVFCYTEIASLEEAI